MALYPSLELYGDIADIYLDNATYSDAVWLTSHNAFVSIDDGWDVHPQQKMTIYEQFHYGAKSFMIDVHQTESEDLILQHGKHHGLPGVGHPSTSQHLYLNDFLANIKTFLEKNRSEIITLHVENYVSNTALKKALDHQGLSKYLLKTNPNDPGVQLGWMRENNQTLVVFSDEQDNALGIHKINLIKETTYDLSRDKKCVDREEGRASFNNKEVKLFLLNHFHSWGCVHGYTKANHLAEEDCSAVNSYAHVMQRVSLCVSQGYTPNFIAVDFIEKGDAGGAIAAVIELNKMYKPKYGEISNQKSSPQQSPYDVNFIVHFILVPLTPSLIISPIIDCFFYLNLIKQT